MSELDDFVEGLLADSPSAAPVAVAPNVAAPAPKKEESLDDFVDGLLAEPTPSPSRVPTPPLGRVGVTAPSLTQTAISWLTSPKETGAYGMGQELNAAKGAAAGVMEDKARLVGTVRRSTPYALNFYKSWLSGKPVNAALGEAEVATPQGLGNEEADFWGKIRAEVEGQQESGGTVGRSVTDAAAMLVDAFALGPVANAAVGPARIAALAKHAPKAHAVLETMAGRFPTLTKALLESPAGAATISMAEMARANMPTWQGAAAGAVLPGAQGIASKVPTVAGQKVAAAVIPAAAMAVPQLASGDTEGAIVNFLTGLVMGPQGAPKSAKEFHQKLKLIPPNDPSYQQFRDYIGKGPRELSVDDAQRLFDAIMVREQRQAINGENAPKALYPAPIELPAPPQPYADLSSPVASERPLGTVPRRPWTAPQRRTPEGMPADPMQIPMDTALEMLRSSQEGAVNDPVLSEPYPNRLRLPSPTIPVSPGGKGVVLPADRKSLVKIYKEVKGRAPSPLATVESIRAELEQAAADEPIPHPVETMGDTQMRSGGPTADEIARARGAVRSAAEGATPVRGAVLPEEEPSTGPGFRKLRKTAGYIAEGGRTFGDVARFSPTLRKFGSDMTKALTTARKRDAMFLEGDTVDGKKQPGHADVVSAMSGKDKKWWKEEGVSALRNSKPIPDTPGGKMAQFMRQKLNALGDELEAAGLITKRGKGDYIPQIQTEDAAAQIDSKTGPIWEALVANGYDPNILQKMSEGGQVKNRKMYWEHERLLDLPETVTHKGKTYKVLETDPAILESYVKNAHRRLAVWFYAQKMNPAGMKRGKEDSSAVNNVINRAITEMSRGKSLDWNPQETAAIVKDQVERLWKDTQGLPPVQEDPQSLANRIVNNKGYKLLENVTDTKMLSAASIPNLVTGWVPYYTRHGAKATLRDFGTAWFTRLHGNSKFAKTAREAGIRGKASEEISYLSGADARANQLSNIVATATGMNLANTKINMAVAGGAPKVMGELVGRVQGGKRSWLRKRMGTDAYAAERYLRDEIGFSDRDITRMKKDGPNDLDLAMYTQRELELINARAEMPTGKTRIMQSPSARILFKYTSFPRKAVRTGKHALGEAGKGNLMPLARLIVGSQASGAAVIAVKNYLNDRRREDKSYPEWLYRNMAELAISGLYSEIEYPIRQAKRLGPSAGIEEMGKNLMPPVATEVATELEAITRAAGIFSAPDDDSAFTVWWDNFKKTAPALKMAETQLYKDDPAAIIERIEPYIYLSPKNKENKPVLSGYKGKEATVAYLVDKLRKKGWSDFDIVNAIKKKKRAVNPDAYAGSGGGFRDGGGSERIR